MECTNEFSMMLDISFTKFVTKSILEKKENKIDLITNNHFIWYSEIDFNKSSKMNQ